MKKGAGFWTCASSIKPPPKLCAEYLAVWAPFFPWQKGRCVGNEVENSENRSSNPASCLGDPGNIHRPRVQFWGIEKAETLWKSRLSAFDIQIVSASWSEWRDLNPRPLGPEPSAIPSFATPGRKNVHRIEADQGPLCSCLPIIKEWDTIVKSKAQPCLSASISVPTSNPTPNLDQ